MKLLSPTVKGAITGVLMIIVFLILNSLKVDAGSPLPYLLYLIFFIGIIWTILSAAVSGQAKTFGNLFNNGFKCFIVATLFISLAIFFYYKFHPELIEQSAELTRRQLLQQKNRTPAEIEEAIKQGKAQYPLMAVSINIFQYLLLGAIVSASTAGLLSLQKKKF